MTHLDTEIQKLRTTVIEMWELVLKQLEKSREAVDKLDKDLAHDININEKRVDAYELKVDMDCENILALFNPLANDLRFVLAVLKINYNLERIGDYARGIAKLLNENEKNLDKKSLEETKLFEMFDAAILMVSTGLEAFEKENNQKARSIFSMDETIDKVSKKANKIVACLIDSNPSRTSDYLNLLTIIRKLERAGDHTKNIAEEIVFYLEAKVLRHAKKKEKIGN